VYLDRAVFGCGTDCAETLGLVVRRWRFAPAPPQPGPTLLDLLEDHMTHPRRFLLAHDGVTVAEGVVFSDGAAIVYRLPTEGHPSGNHLYDRYPAGTAVAGRLGRADPPARIVRVPNDNAKITFEWLDPYPVGYSGPGHTGELAEPDLTGPAL
jgi:hypothetical protein